MAKVAVLGSVEEVSVAGPAKGAVEEVVAVEETKDKVETEEFTVVVEEFEGATNTEVCVLPVERWVEVADGVSRVVERE